MKRPRQMRVHFRPDPLPCLFNRSPLRRPLPCPFNRSQLHRPPPNPFSRSQLHRPPPNPFSRNQLHRLPPNPFSRNPRPAPRRPRNRCRKAQQLRQRHPPRALVRRRGGPDRPAAIGRRMPPLQRPRMRLQPRRMLRPQRRRMLHPQQRRKPLQRRPTRLHRRVAAPEDRPCHRLALRRWCAMRRRPSPHRSRPWHRAPRP